VRRLEAAKAAAGAPNNPPPPGPTPAALDAAALEEKARQLVATCELVQVITLGVLGRAFGAAVPAAEFHRLARYAPEERALLLELAPAAVPYVDRFLEAWPWIPAALFGGAAALGLVGRIRTLRELAPAKPKKKAAAPDSAAAPASS
jgi:hypothetical protein